MLLAAGPARAQPVRSEFSAAFDRIDRHAQEVAGRLKCIGDAVGSERKGMVGPADTAGTHLICAWLKGRFVAAYIATDSTWKRATKFVALDPARNALISEQIDTAEVLVLLRAQRYALWLASRGPDVATDTVDYLPPVVYRPDTTIHVWIVPGRILPLQNPATGGERHYVFPADARKELAVESIPPVRPVRIPASGDWVIESRNAMPTFSELLFVNMLNLGGLQATIVTPTQTVRLVGPPALAAWVFLPRKP